MSFKGITFTTCTYYTKLPGTVPGNSSARACVCDITTVIGCRMVAGTTGNDITKNGSCILSEFNAQNMHLLRGVNFVYLVEVSAYLRAQRHL